MMKKVLVLLALMAVTVGSSAATVEELRNPDLSGLQVNKQEMEAPRLPRPMWNGPICRLPT